MRGIEGACALLSIVLMGACGVQLLLRLTRLLRGQETADGLAKAYAKGTGVSELDGACTGECRGASLYALCIAAGAALLSRWIIYALAYWMYRTLGIGADSFADSFMPLWYHWDVRHYIDIAREGYTAVGDARLRLVFFPLYPLLMRMFSPMTGGDVFLSGTAISLLCAAVATAALYDLAHMHFGARTAKLAVGYFLLNPLSVFLGCVYTESIFIALTLLALCAHRRGRGYTAAVLGMFSAFTRMPGVIVAGFFIIELLGRVGERTLTRRALLRCAAQVAIVFCGLFAYWGVNAAVTGDPLMYMTYQRENWFQQPGTFFGSTANTAHYFMTTVGESDWLYTWGFQLLCMFYVYVLLLRGQKKLPFDMAAYGFVYVLVVLSPTWLLSGPRYLYALCILPLLQARAHERGGWHALALALSTVLLAIFVFGYAIAVTVL